jgi:hypothetical protein
MNGDNLEGLEVVFATVAIFMVGLLISLLTSDGRRERRRRREERRKGAN